MGRLQAERDALAMLEEAGIDPEDLPIDPVRVARRLKIEVQDADLEFGASGTLIKEPGGVAVISLDRRPHENRRRFTCAHELGHWFRRRKQGRLDDGFAFVDNRDHLSGRGTDSGEIYSNQFAAGLLMPAETVRRYRRRGLTSDQMAIAFGVSEESMHIRLDNLRL